MKKYGKCLVVKNSYLLRRLLRDVYHCVGTDRRTTISPDKYNEKWLVIGIMNPDWCPMLEYYDAKDKFYEDFLVDNPHCEYPIYLEDFINKMNNLVKTYTKYIHKYE